MSLRLYGELGAQYIYVAYMYYPCSYQPMSSLTSCLPQLQRSLPNVHLIRPYLLPLRQLKESIGFFFFRPGVIVIIEALGVLTICRSREPLSSLHRGIREQFS